MKIKSKGNTIQLMTNSLEKNFIRLSSFYLFPPITIHIYKGVKMIWNCEKYFIIL